MPGLRCFRRPESSHINVLVLIFFRLACARAKGLAGRRGSRFASPGAPIILGSFTASVLE